MDATSAQDLRLREGGWQPYDVFSGSAEEDLFIEDHLASQGWSAFLTVGDPGTSSVSLATWRGTEDGRFVYLLQVGNRVQGSEFLRVDDLPTLMDLLAKWSPVVQAAQLAELALDLNGSYLDPGGLVETLAARAAWGAEERLPELRAERERIIQAGKQRAEAEE